MNFAPKFCRSLVSRCIIAACLSFLPVLLCTSQFHARTSYGAFLECTSLTKIEIPASVTTIGSGAFHDCSSLEIVSFEEGSKLITIKDGYKDGGNTVYGAFTNCDNLTLFDASNCTQIKTIGNYAFNYRNRWNSQISFTIKLGTEIPPILTYTKDEYYTQLLILIAEIVNT